MCDALLLDEYFEVVVEVVREAGKLIRDVFSLDKCVTTKNGYADLVTDTDHHVEDTIIRTLAQHYPQHRFIGEEMVAAGVACALTDDPTWIIDPIDGTTNFVHRFPHVAVSVALLVNKKVMMGIVYNPILEHMYTARPGRGAFCNGRQLHVTSTADLNLALICAEFGSCRNHDVLDAKFRSMRNVISQARGLRSIGSAALHMCMVAAGELDAHFTYGIHIWDIAAGDLIVREAGGVVVDTSGGPLDLFARQVLCAATEQLAQQIACHIEHIKYKRELEFESTASAGAV